MKNKKDAEQLAAEGQANQQPETDFHATHAPGNCEHAGKGGSYVIENGKRVLVERTKVPGEREAAK